MLAQPFGPSPGRVERVLHDGYWDRIELVRLEDGCLRVRKSSKGTEAPGPWARRILRSEIQYLNSLGGPAAGYFPTLHSYWNKGEALGYAMSYYPDLVQAGELAQSADLSQDHVTKFQTKLGKVIFEILHKPVAPSQSLSSHIREVIESVLAKLGKMSEFAPLLSATTLRINGQRLSGPRKAMAQLFESENISERIDQDPQVRLHGDCILENILLPRTPHDPNWPSRLILIDPVSVAGVYQGHPLFDLVKYESYATGELPALRAGKIETDGFNNPSRNCYVYRPCLEDPSLRTFRQIDWISGFRAAYVEKYGKIDETVYELLDAYFAFVMAMCTDSQHRHGRLLKGIIALNAAIKLQHY